MDHTFKSVHCQSEAIVGTAVLHKSDRPSVDRHHQVAVMISIDTRTCPPYSQLGLRWVFLRPTAHKIVLGCYYVLSTIVGFLHWL
jgi:hypothetical protein